jgi:hypothetical protein
MAFLSDTDLLNPIIVELQESIKDWTPRTAVHKSVNIVRESFRTGSPTIRALFTSKPNTKEEREKEDENYSD